MTYFQEQRLAAARGAKIVEDFDYYLDVNEKVAAILAEAIKRLSSLDLDNVPSAIPHLDLRDIIPTLDDMMPDTTKHAGNLLTYARERYS